MGRATCRFQEPWRPPCGKRVVEGDYCSEHQDIRCRVCCDQASRKCEKTHGLVCGIPLCDDCDCPSDHRGI